MSSIASRKKSIISASGVSIEQPIANNTLLNKAASSSLYQQCSQLRPKLYRIPNFAEYFALSSNSTAARRSTDPVTQLWDCFSLGVPLCYLYNLLPNVGKTIDVDVNPAIINPDDARSRKIATARFIMALKNLALADSEQFQVTDLINDRSTTDGFVKVVRVATALVNRLPPDVFSVEPSSPPPTIVPSESTDSLAMLDSAPAATDPKETARNNIIREMVETERKYVQDLEVMQRYATASSSVIDRDTIHNLFPNLNRLLNFQRRFLIRMEGIAEVSWPQQHWGLPFMECEEDFDVYVPYCANYVSATDLMMQEGENLTPLNNIIHSKSELPAFLIKPVQRICKYPLLLESLVKVVNPVDYPFYNELKDGLAASKRITDKINEAQRRSENVAAVDNLSQRVADWKGHHLSHFGELLLDDLFVVNKTDVDREYHVFLFEKIILCCKEVVQTPMSAKKVSKSNSILKKPQAPPLALPGGVGPPKKKDTPLLLKGRIFLTNVTQAVPSNKVPGQHALSVHWSGEDEMEYFTLRCRTEDQLTKWENAINKLIVEIKTRRASERSSGSRSNGSTGGPQPMSAYDRQSTSTSRTNSTSFASFPAAPTGRFRQPSAYGSDAVSPIPSNPYPTSVAGGYPGANGFEVDGEDEYEDYPAVNGRGTPVGRRTPARTPVDYADERPDYRSSNSAYSSPVAPHINGLPSGPSSRGPMSRPSMSRLPSAASNNSGGSTYSSDGGYASANGTRPLLRSKFSTTKLNGSFESDARGSAPGLPSLPAGNIPARLRSASQPTAYVPKMPPPPMPTSTRWDEPQTAGERKRGSGSSASTAESSEYSPHTSSPITPYGSSDSMYEPLVKVKVHFHEDIFIVQVPNRIEFGELIEKVGKKIRLCGPRRDDGPLRVKYRDEDGDMVSLGSTEDVQMAFETRPAGQVTLYVT